MPLVLLQNEKKRALVCLRKKGVNQPRVALLLDLDIRRVL